ncbi:hypothetical protein F5Y12DRAFT_791875 [Xylaria sp. FL1777]|nr:hypothetical protein F5Y12DRAFT_791875 [Xylaria sp. FL1777]
MLPYQRPANQLQHNMWEENKTILRRLYLTERKRLKDVKRVMESEHGFPTTPLSTYESKLRDLGLRKKMKGKDWRPVYKHYMNSGRRHTAVFFNGTRIPWDRAWKEIRRSGARESNDGETTRLPTDVIMRTPSPVLVPQSAFTLCRAPPVPWYLSDAPLEGLSLDAIFRRLMLYDIPSNLLRIDMLSTVQQLPTRLHTESNQSCSNHHSLPGSTNQNPEYTLLHPLSTAPRPGPQHGEICSDIDRLSRALYRLANGEVWVERPLRGPLDDSLEVVFNLTPKHILLKLLEGDSPTIRAAVEELIESSARLGRKEDFRSLVEAVVCCHPEWIVRGRYLVFAGQVGCADTCRLLPQMRHRPEHEPSNKFAAFYRRAVLDSIVYQHFECANILFQHVVNADSARLPEDITANMIFSHVLCAAADGVYYSGLNLRYDFSPRTPGVLQLLNWFLEAGVDVDTPTPQFGTRSLDLFHTRYILILRPTLLDYVYFQNLELYSHLVCYSVEYRTILTRSGIHRSAIEGIDSLGVYLLSRPSYKPVRQDSFLGIVLTEEFLKSIYGHNLNFNVVHTLLSYNLGLLQFCSELNPSIILYGVVKAASKQGIHPAVRYIIKTLIQEGAVIVAETIAGAIENKGTSVLRLLFSYGADFKNQGVLALCTAIYNENYDAINWLLSVGVDINATVPGHGHGQNITVLAWTNLPATLSSFRIFDYKLAIPSILLLRPMSGAMLEYLISKSVKLRVNPRDPSARNLLCLIISHGYKEEYLTEALKKAKLLLDAEFIPDDPSGTEQCLFEALFQSCHELVSPALAIMELLLDYGIPIKKHSCVLADLIHLGAPRDKIQRVLDDGVDVNTRSPQQRTPLQEAAAVASLEWVQVLIQRGADVNQPAEGYFGRTALQSACEAIDSHVNLDLIKFLIANGADVNAPPSPDHGITAFQAAAMNGDFEVALLLLDNGANINAPPSEKSGYCALDGAVCYGKLDMVQFLLDLGALSHERGETGYRGTIRIAEKRGYQAIADMIRQHALKNGSCGEELFAHYTLWEGEHSSSVDYDDDSDDSDDPSVSEVFVCRVKLDH